MVITMKSGCLKRNVAFVIKTLESKGCAARIISPGPKVVLGLVEEINHSLMEEIRGLVTHIEGVEDINTFDTTWKLVSRAFTGKTTAIKVGSRTIGNGEVVVMAGPCAVESREGIIAVAREVAARGAGILRGGAFKPRTSPYSFRGLGEDGLKHMAEAREITGLPIITEVITPHEVPLVAKYADILQIGARNMQNFALLEAAGEADRPVMLKRGMMGTIQELLLCAEYIVARGNGKVMLCERGIRTYETETRNTLDIAAVPLLKEYTHLPVVVDPSHAAGKRELVPAMAMAAVAAGADAIMVEVHPEPDKAFSDGRQSLTPDAFGVMMQQLARVAQAVDRHIPGV